jgi:hypothetical protein
MDGLQKIDFQRIASIHFSQPPCVDYILASLLGK